MKKVIFSILAVGALASCVKEQTLNVAGPAAIEFAGTYVENATKSNDPSTTTDNITQFSVWGVMDNETGVVLNDELVTLTDGAWTYVNTQYWTPQHTYYFSAIAGDRANDQIVIDFASADDNGMSVDGLGTVTFTNVEGINDVLYAEANDVETEDVVNTKPEAVKFQFNHLLSKVKFTFTNGFVNNNNTIVVKNVKMSVPAKGTIDLTNTDEGYVWTNLQGETILDMGHMAEGARVAIGAENASSSDNERLTIPAPATQEYEVTFDVELWMGDVMASNASKTVKINGCILEPGKSYNFKATLNQDNIDENPLYPIEFEVAVDEWVEVEYDGGVIATNAVSTETEFVEAVQNGGLVTLAKDIELTSPLEVKSVATKAAETAHAVTIDLNGHNISGTDTGTASWGLLNVMPGVSLTIKGEGNITASATQNRGWNAYSSVISNQRGYLTVEEGVVIEHLGGTDMAYGIDNLTNGKGTEAITVVNGATVKSTYRAIRQFLNGVEATNELYVEAGSKVEGANKSIWSQDPSKNANTGKLVVEEGAELYGDVYLFVTEGSTEWPVEATIPVSTLKNGAEVLSGNVPAGYAVVAVDGVYTILTNAVAVSTAEELQAAFDANSGYQIIFANDIVGDASVLQVADVNVVVNGNGYKYDGSILVNGNGRSTGAETLTFRNINFNATEAKTFLNAPSKVNDKYNYSHNVTIEDCTFTGNYANGVEVGAASFTGTYNLVMRNVEAYGMHSLLQVQSCDNTVLVENVKAIDCKNGISVGNTAYPTIRNAEIVSAEYGVRGDGNASRGNLVIENSSITANQPIVIRKVTTNGYTLNVSESTKLVTENIYAVIFTTGSDDAEYVAPTVEYSYNVPSQYNVFPLAEGAPVKVATDTQLREQLKNGSDVVLTEDINTTDAESNGYGATGININGGVFDGNGHTIEVEGATSTWDSAIAIKGGTIKNVTIAKGFRGIFFKNGTEKIVLENVIIKGPVYTISQLESRDLKHTTQSSMVGHHMQQLSEQVISRVVHSDQVLVITSAALTLLQLM